MSFKEKIIDKLKITFPGITFISEVFRDELTMTINKKDVIKVASFLKDDNELNFNLCEDVTAIDWARRKDRFSVVYQLFSIKNKFRLRLKCNVDESDCKVESVSSIWKSADWAERETYDMYGIEFINHNDLRRMYMPEEFDYFPLRKEFPLMGIPGSLPLPKK